eukprot:9810388-Ditylum_brightwellii.AAC.1
MAVRRCALYDRERDVFDSVVVNEDGVMSDPNCVHDFVWNVCIVCGCEVDGVFEDIVEGGCDGVVEGASEDAKEGAKEGECEGVRDGECE